jgi:dienelactone hydrolase
VPFEDNATPTKQALLSEGASVDLQEYKGASHGFVGNNAANTAARTKSKAETVKFFKSNL